MSWNWRKLVYLVGATFILYSVGILSVYIFINSILFKNDRTSDYHLPITNQISLVEIPLPSDQFLNAALYTPRSDSRGIVLLLHDIKGNLNRYNEQSVSLLSKGFSVLVPDYRGFGMTKGKTSENTLNEDALACMDWLNKMYREDSIYIYAMGFMAPVASYINTLLPVRLLILENPVYSLRSWIKRKYPYFILPYELKYDFNTYEFIPNCISPVYIIQSKQKANSSNTEILKLRQLLQDPSAFIQLSDEKGENIYELNQYQNYLDLILND